MMSQIQGPGDFLEMVKRTAEVKALLFLGSSVVSLLLYLLIWPWLGSKLVFVAALYGIYSFSRKLAAGGQCDYFPDLTGKVAIVTGANAGIGRDTVVELLKMGATVVMGCRSKAKAQEAVEYAVGKVKKYRGTEFAEVARSRIRVIDLDLCSFASIRSFAADVNREFEIVDILVNNAGVMFPPWQAVKPSEDSPEGIELQFLSNHIGHFYLTHQLLDSIKKANAGRIVNLSSVGHTMHNRLKIHKSADGFNTQVAYGNSKLANILFTKELQKRLDAESGNKVTVYSAHPGGVMTDLVRHMADPRTLAALSPLIGMFFKYPEEGCQTSLFCAVHPAAVRSEYHSDCRVGWTVAAASDMKLAAELWTMSEKIVAAAGSREKKD
eukprot:TRINITY_DN1709_c0_g1_i1.p1 TRINITY_DN1709_c0_g1~~TRINITY_DN1709_c0_g1_i1.p1  ORF type:complete len:381 (+),score=116.63 TRINITY_DN1709_c0_g1_i1:1358-2500(+)